MIDYFNFHISKLAIDIFIIIIAILLIVSTICAIQMLFSHMNEKRQSIKKKKEEIQKAISKY